jgi:hypothetical protein
MRPPLSSAAALAALALAALAAPAAAQTVHGRVVDRENDRPVQSVTVQLRSNGDVRAQTTTGADGTFSLPVPGAGTYQLAAGRIGFQTLVSSGMRIERLDSMDLTLRLDANEVMLDTVEARTSERRPPARLAAFYERAGRRRQGYFLTREAIEAARASRTSDLLRRIPGLQFRPTAKGYIVRGRGGCEPQVYVDGMDVNLWHNSNTVDELVRPEDLEGIEVYGSSSIPVEFERSTAGMECGAVLLWTRTTR